MKKEKIATIICWIALFAGYLFYKYVHWTWWGPFISGSAFMLLILATIGFRQNRRAAARLDKIITDSKL